MMSIEINTIKEFGKKGKGRSELLKHLHGESLTRGDAILAKCYDCMGWYNDGTQDCEIPHCPLYKYMPYRQELQNG